MVKIALRKLFAGILCGCVVLLVGYEVSDEEKASEPLHILTALFTTRIHKENKQIYRTNQPRENFGQHNPLHEFLSASWKTEQNPCKNKHGENCIAQVVCWYFVRLCGAAGVGCEVSEGKNHPNLSIFQLHFSPPEFTKKTNKFYRTNQPRENFGQHNPLHVFLSA